jgi:pimeloyl-ACP methyl ester carboxylesterase
LRKPALLEKLVLEGAVLPGSPMSRTVELQARASDIARAQGVPAALADWLENADWFANMNEHPAETGAAGQRVLVNEFDGAPWLSDLVPHLVTGVRSRLDEIDQHTLLYNGAEDLDEFEQVATVLEAELANVERLVIPGAGGFPLWERPSRVVPIVLKHLGA